MSLLNRAFLYLIRKKGRSILLFIIMFVMSVLLIAGFTIKASADQAAEELRKSIGSSFNFEITTNNTALYEPVTDESGFTYQKYTGPLITEEMKNRILSIDGVSDYTVKGNALCAYTSLDLYPAYYAERYLEESNNPTPVSQPPFRLKDYEVERKSTLFFGTKNSNLHEYFRTGALRLVQGRSIEEDDINKAIISTDMAQRNNLDIGDTFTAEVKEGNQMISDDPMRIMGEPVELEIIGLFNINFQQDYSGFTTEWDIVDNYIFIDYNSKTELRSYMGVATDNKVYGELTFFVDDPQDLDRVLNKVRAMDGIDWQYYTLELDDVAYRASVKPLTQMSGFSSFLIIASILGVIIMLYLILTMWAKSRKREIGILLSMGKTKANVRWQMILECLFIAAITLILAFAVSRFIISAFGNFSEQLVAPASTGEMYTVDSQIGSLAPVIDKVSTEPVELSYSLSIQNAILIVAIVLGGIVSSVFVATVQVFKMKPKDILSSI